MQFATSLCAPCCRLQWLNDQSMDPGNLLHGQIDLGRLATAGHSRGGKIAALAYTREPRGPPPLSPPCAPLNPPPRPCSLLPAPMVWATL